MFDISTWVAICSVVVVLLICIPLATCVYRELDRREQEKVRGVFRGSPLLLLFAITFGVVMVLNPAKAGLALWGVSKLALGAYLGYWADRLGFRPEDRPHLLEGISRGTAWKRRAIIMSAAIIAGAFIP